MAFSATQSPTERGPPHLLSNNPFRNRTGPPSSANPTTYRPTTNGRSLSSNPFLDSTDIALRSPDSTMGENAEELLEARTNVEQPRRPPPPPPVHCKVTGPGPENVRPHEKDLATANWNVFADSCDTSPKRLHNTSPKRPQRRNSDTSVRESSGRAGASDHGRQHRRSRKEKPNRKLDMIDKLDGTSIFGTGLIHHDGPYEACNPHHKQKGSRAPIHAFPKDSENVALGGVGPNNSKMDLEKYNGLSAQGYTDYSASAVGVGGDRPINSRSASFNPLTKEEPLHGEESMGLGTSTFLDGAPASRTAMQRRQSDFEGETNGLGRGLGRKKSLAVKIRGISHKPLSPEFREQPRTATSPPGTSQTLSDRNPFFKDYDEEYEKKGAQISGAGDQAGSARAPNPKPLGLERKMTAESVGEGAKSGAGGFLRRVRSLKGGPRR